MIKKKHEEIQIYSSEKASVPSSVQKKKYNS